MLISYVFDGIDLLSNGTDLRNIDVKSWANSYVFDLASPNWNPTLSQHNKLLTFMSVIAMIWYGRHNFLFSGFIVRVSSEYVAKNIEIKHIDNLYAYMITYTAF